MSVPVTVSDVLDLEKLANWLQSVGLGSGQIDDPLILTGGTQNVLVRFKFDGRDLVLRRPPPRPRPNSNALIMREATVLRALANTSVPHAALVGTCDDESVLGGAAFYVMEAVEGFNPAERLPKTMSDYETRERIALDATDALAAIAALDYVDIGLDGFGKPEGFLDRQVGRWVGERDGYLGLAGYEGLPLPGFEAVRDYLEANVPASFRAGLMHGDYHLGNLLLDEHSARVRAVLDWEMSTIGDPLMDLGRYIAMWPDEHEVIIDTGAIWEAGPLPSPDRLVDRYIQQSGSEIKHLQWYVVMGCFKLGIILEGTYARSCAGFAPKHIGMLLHLTAVRLFERASRLIGATHRDIKVLWPKEI